MSRGHVYVTICGFGKRVVPAHSPVEFALQSDGSLVVELDGKREVVTKGQVCDGSAIGEGEVADVVDGLHDDCWWIDAAKFRMPFPFGWTVFADGGVLPPFFLERSGDRTLFIQIADNVPTGDELVAPSQSVVNRNPVGPYESLELAYEYEGHAWLQRHTVLTRGGRPYAVLTAQAPLDGFDEARELHLSIAASVLIS